jgi:hypothetical protein
MDGIQEKYFFYPLCIRIHADLSLKVLSDSKELKNETD